MNGYLLPVACVCGGGLAPVTEGRPFGATEVSAVAICNTCGRDWHIKVAMLPGPGPVERQRNTMRQRERQARLRAVQ